MDRNQYRRSEQEHGSAETDRDMQNDEQVDRTDDTDMSEKGSDDMEHAR